MDEMEGRTTILIECTCRTICRPARGLIIEGTVTINTACSERRKHISVRIDLQLEGLITRPPLIIIH